MLNRLPHLALLTSLALAAMAPALARAQSSPVGELRLVDAEGVELPREPADFGDQIYRLPEGTTDLDIAFDFTGTAETDVQIRVIGNIGSILYQESESYGSPNTYVVRYEHGDPLPVGEYVINAYVGDDVYLADSFQLAVGEAVTFPTPQSGGESSMILTPESESELAPPAPTLETPVDAGQAPGASPLLLALAGLGMVVLFGIVLWAGRSAMRRS
jgi:hypothetical protein